MSWPGLPQEIISRNIQVNDLDVHILEGFPPQKPADLKLLMLVHGFPEIAYSWRKVIKPLADAGYHVVAPDLRGYGQTRTLARDGALGRKIRFEEDLNEYRLLNITTDIIAIIQALGYSSAAAVVGHDYGSAIAALCALIRPDVFKSVVLMSAPFPGPPPISMPLNVEDFPIQVLNEQLATLSPPRKHYFIYYSTPGANQEMCNPAQGLHAFFRDYYHMKSADWKLNKPAPLLSYNGESLAQLPHYYVLPLADTMAQAVARDAPSAEEVARNKWLPEEELAVYVAQYEETGFQGGLNHYRCLTDPKWTRELRVFSGKQIQVPAMFLSGKQDWGVYQNPGATDAMKFKVCADMKEDNFVLVDGAGHWIQQEQPDAVVANLLRFLETI